MLRHTKTFMTMTFEIGESNFLCHYDKENVGFTETKGTLSLSVTSKRPFEQNGRDIFCID